MDLIDDEEDDDSMSEETIKQCEDSESEEEEPDEDKELFGFWFKKHWRHYRPRLLPDIVRVAHVLSPHPKVREYVRDHPEREDRKACKQLLMKMMMPLNIVDLNQRAVEEVSCLFYF